MILTWKNCHGVRLDNHFIIMCSHVHAVNETKEGLNPFAALSVGVAIEPI